jgi:uncharacterized protein
LFRWRVSGRWYAVALLTAPLVVAPVLLVLSLFSSDYRPELLSTDDVVALLGLGLAGGFMGGFLEELGWTGLAVPALKTRHGILSTALIVSAMWALWHVPVTLLSSISAAGTVSWSDLLPPMFFYVAVLPAFRVLMVWVYDRTKSLLVAILMHASLAATTFFILLPPAMGLSLVTYYVVLAVGMWVAAGAVVVAEHAGSSGARVPVTN